MLFSARWIDVTYEVAFATPVFELPTRNVSILKAFYETVGPRYALTLSDLQVAGGATLDDVRARIVMFGGNGVFDVSVEKFTAAFTNLRTRADMDIFKDCVTLSNEALQKVMPDLTYREAAIASNIYLDLHGSERAATDFLDHLPSGKRLIDTPKGTEIHYGLLADLANSSEDWHISLRMERSYLQQQTLILSARARYGMGGALQGFDQQAAHLESTLESVFEALGLERDTSR